MTQFDLMQQLGALALASRLKRLADRLMRDVSRIYADLHVEFQARWFPVVYYLKDRNEVPVTTVAADLGLTHPAVNQVAAVLTRKGLLISTRDRNDERRRLLSLSEKGRRTVAALEPVWREIAAANEGFIAGTGVDLLATLQKLERELDEIDMYSRVRSRLNRSSRSTT